MQRHTDLSIIFKPDGQTERAMWEALNIYRAGVESVNLMFVDASVLYVVTLLKKDADKVSEILRWCNANP